MRFGLALTALALASTGGLTQVAAQTPVAAPARVHPAAHKAACDEMVAELTPETDITQQTDRLISTMLSEMTRSDPGFAEMERDYPGLSVAMGAALRPIMLRVGFETLPLYRAELSQMYQDNLTTAEARQVTAMLRTPEWRSFRNKAAANTDYKSTAGALLREEDASIASTNADRRSTARRMADDVTPAELNAIKTFFSSPLGRKFMALNPKKQAIELKWFNYSPPGMEQEVLVTLLDAMILHIAKTDPETAAMMRRSLEADGKLPKKAN
jgi:hypothetical protein